MTTDTLPDLTPDAVMDQLSNDLGGSLGVLLTSLGTRSGLWVALDGRGPQTSEEVAALVQVSPALVREWLRAQAAAGYLTYDPGAGTFTLPAGVADAVLRGPGAALIEACVHMLSSMAVGFEAFSQAFSSGRGFGWDERSDEYFHGTDMFTRVVLPAEVVVEALRLLAVDEIRSVLDVGCGYGAPTLAVAGHCSGAAVLGVDYHDDSVSAARRAAADAGLAERVRFETASATDLPGTGYDLITFFDSLHDLGDPVGALRAARDALAPNGSVLLVEPSAADRVEDNLHVGGRLLYSVSTLVCTPNAVAQQVPGAVAPLGTLAGEARLTEVATAAGFAAVRRLPVEAPMNLLLELRVR